MTDRQKLASAIRGNIPGGKIPAAALPAFDALADALGLPRDEATRLGALSAQYETGGRGPGTVSTGVGDPGGVSYGSYQLASKTGTATAFVRAEGAAWPQLGNAPPGSPAFSAVWRDIAAREPQAFDDAQHAFIERTHYRPVVAAVLARTGLDLDARAQPVRDAVWSIAVQHGKAPDILTYALATRPQGDEATLRAIYAARSAYVRKVAERSTGANRRTLLSVVENRYPSELAQALAAL